MTIGQGDAIWEKFGHNAIWIRDRERGVDVAYNYGMFAFDEPGYLGRFLRGDMLYWMLPLDAVRSAEEYANANRSVWLQELNLTPAQRVRLRDFVEWNARPENRTYLYDYYRDNCSTRVRDAIDMALGGALRAATEDVPTGTTYRSHSLRLTASEIAAYTGLLLGLGPLVDHPLDAWEESFIPMQLREHVRRVRVTGPDGAEAPLVLSEQTLFEATRADPPARAPDRTPLYLAFSTVIAGAMLLAWRFGRGGSRVGWVFLVLALLWSLTAGLFGSILAALWAFTNHVAAHRNENLFQVNPFSLALAVALALALIRPSARRAAAWLALVVAGISLVGLAIQVLPGLDQVNGGIIALALPLHLAVALGLASSLRRQPSPKEDRARTAARSGLKAAA
jgi:hypothetical protein